MSTNYAELKKDILAILEEKKCGPLLIRLSWHDAGTYCKHSNTGGARGAMRFEAGESQWGANAGLDIARDIVGPLMAKHPSVCHADLWAFAACVAVESMGGPTVPFKSGRKDIPDHSHCVADGRLPDGDKGADHIREIFYRMGFTDQDIVILSGAHTVGSCHLDRSGFDGPWTEDSQKFDNSYFKDLLSKTWEKATTDKGNPQYAHTSTKTMMLETDLALVSDPKFRPFVEKYAADEDAFKEDFAVAFQKLQELGYSDLTAVEY